MTPCLMVYRFAGQWPASLYCGSTRDGRHLEKGTVVARSPWLSVNARQMGGVPCVRGLRIPVATVVGMVAYGLSVDEIVAELSPIEHADFKRWLRFAADAVSDREIPLKRIA